MPDAIGKYVDAVPVLADQWYYGSYQVRGTVDRLGVPGRFFVQLRLNTSFALVRGAVSDSETGEYTITNLPAGSASAFLLVVRDRDWRFGSEKANAAISDQLTVELMP